MPGKSENTNYVNYLVELSQAGRKNAFFDLCEINLKSVFTTVYRLTADYNSARSVTVQAFLNAWEEIKEYDYKIPFALWIKQIAITTAIPKINKSSMIKLPDELPDDNKKKLETLIMNLDYFRRTIFVLHDLEGYDYGKIAEFLWYDNADEIVTALMETREYLIDAVCKR
ncbi:RNA polymerase sigma factor [Melioribacter sp. Ez-97]|jgi:RNA polymerase sigma-70 factor (ECF subfamily)|uniref:RNA polymerase sigma factor n=1 Tax=Melioribacter sp. Ez-97 TaxID=3423434 RepID=UPI003EDAB1F4